MLDHHGRIYKTRKAANEAAKENRVATKKKTAKKSTAWMDDHDDAHFSDNPAFAKKSKKKIELPTKGHAAVKATRKKSTTRKKYAVSK